MKNYNRSSDISLSEESSKVALFVIIAHQLSYDRHLQVELCQEVHSKTEIILNPIGPLICLDLDCKGCNSP
jgi:hypothetical protein